MLLNFPTLPASAERRPLDRKAAGPRLFQWTGPVAAKQPAPPADNSATDRVVLRRGPKMMVLFRGRPCPYETGALRQAGVTIGLALSSGELPTVPSLDDYGYVFVSSRRRTRSTLGEAVADLERNSWLVEDNPVEAAARPRPSRNRASMRQIFWSAATPMRTIAAFR